MMRGKFPVLGHAGLYIPWSEIEPHRDQAKKNHWQTLEQLAERGGLDPVEMFAVMNDIPWSFRLGKMSDCHAIEWLRENADLGGAA